MKKLIILIAASVIAAVSCQKTIIPGFEQQPDINSAPGKLTATIEKTKVTYSETSSFNLQPAWEVGDKIIGFDDAGNTYTLTVSSVSGDTATLSGTVPDGTLHLIYKSGAKASDISAKTLNVDYTAQKGDKTMPAVMLADGTVTDGACDFTFTNAGAIIGISAVKGVPSGSTISKIIAEGENLSAATVALSGSALALTAKIKSDDAISTGTLSGITVTDANGTLSAPVFIAVPAGAKIAKVSVVVPKEPATMKIPSTAADKDGVDYVTITAKYDGVNLSTKKWAKWNVGANSETDYGWYFNWAGTEGYVWYAKSWQSASATSIKFSYALSSKKRLVQVIICMSRPRVSRLPVLVSIGKASRTTQEPTLQMVGRSTFLRTNHHIGLELVLQTTRRLSTWRMTQLTSIGAVPGVCLHMQRSRQ